MTRYDMIERIGKAYLTSNIEGGEYSYVQEAGSKAALEKAVGRPVSHFKLDIRFEKKDVVILVETKQVFQPEDEAQLAEYLAAERALHKGKKVICILANTNNDKIKVWKSFVEEKFVLRDETVLDSMEHYEKLFDMSKQNDREKVLKNTYDLNELLHKMDIKEDLRSQFVGTTLLYIKDMLKRCGMPTIDDALIKRLNAVWCMMSADEIRAAIKKTLDDLLEGSDNKAKKIELLQKNVLDNQKVKNLTLAHWMQILDTIIIDIYRYIDADSSEGQDILNLFFIAFNKYTGKADKNQAFTPDHITEFMCRLTEIDRHTVVLDPTCGSGSFLVQAMVKEFADCRRGKTAAEAHALMQTVKERHIYGIENEEKAYGLAITNMLIHGNGSSNIKFDSCFNCKHFIQSIDPDVILMNPPYNAKPIGIPEFYKKDWGNARDGKEDSTKGLVFIHFLSDVIKEMNDERERSGAQRKTVKLAVLLPVSAAIGANSLIQNEKFSMLEDNTLEAVFTLPNEMFYPGASVTACCMLFTLGKPHKKPDGTVNETFFGYYKDDGFKKKKNLGRVEQFDANGESRWRVMEEQWLSLFRNRKVVDGLSATAVVDGNAEWLCEAYMKTDYSKLTEADFRQTVNDYLAYLVKSGEVYEAQ